MDSGSEKMTTIVIGLHVLNVGKRCRKTDTVWIILALFALTVGQRWTRNLNLGRKIIMELKDTISMMESNDYKERFRAEYAQLAIRFKKLKAMLDAWDSGTLTFTPTCPRSTYNIQTRAMADYMAILEARAVMEGISL